MNFELSFCILLLKWAFAEIKILRLKLGSMQPGDLKFATNIDSSDLSLNPKIHNVKSSKKLWIFHLLRPSDFSSKCHWKYDF